MTKYIGPKTDGENVATQADKLSLSSDNPDALTPDQSGAAGTALTAARADHQHEITAGIAGTILPDATAGEGSSTSFSRADHTHAIAAASASTITGSNAEGISTSFARADHDHSLANDVIKPAMLDLTIVDDGPSANTDFNSSNGLESGTNVTGLSISCDAGIWLFFANIDLFWTSGGVGGLGIYNQTDSALIGTQGFISTGRIPVNLVRQATLGGTKTIGIRVWSASGTANFSVQQNQTLLTAIRIG